MKDLLCSICKGKGLCGKPCPILQRLRYWRKVVETWKENFMGNSPPSAFIGRYNYPRVFAGFLSTPLSQEANLLEAPELWFKRNESISNILTYRAELVYSRIRTNVKHPEKLFEVTQDLAMSSNPVQVEVWLKHRPKFRFSFDPHHIPIGNPSLLVKAKLVENPKVHHKVWEVIEDFDLKAKEAMIKLWKDFPISFIQRLLSSGLIGLKMQRKLVPSRWSWTAVHSCISDELLLKVKDNPEVPDYQVFHAEYVGNHFEILLAPSCWQFELIESKFPGSVWNLFGKEPLTFSDYEPYFGRKEYAKQTGGAFYAARLATLEALARMKRQAACLIIREVLPSYYAPLGVWVIENTVRQAFSEEPEKFNKLEEALNCMAKRLRNRFEVYESRSKVLKFLRFQRRLNHISSFSFPSGS